MSVWVILEFLLGCALLAWGADRFIAGSVGIAKRFGLSPLIIGVVLIGFGTTFPEIVVAVIASMHHHPDIAIGNAVGSCITNIGLILGIALLVSPIVVRSSLLKREFPLLMLIVIAVGLLLFKQHLTYWDGVLLLIILCLYLVFLMYYVPKDTLMEQAAVEETAIVSKNEPPKFSLAIMWWVIGLLLLFVSSELVVDAATKVARWLHMSELVIGLTIVAVGTSLPELAATIITARRKQYDIAMGNIIGSNVFNLLAVLAMPALISPSRLSPILLSRDYATVIGLTVLLWALSVLPPRRMRLGMGAGVLLIACYMGYIVWVI
jgi:cation:H+ antiporter